MKKRGFTLAEVLITLGVIGIVAAMTLPALVQNHKEKQRVSQLKKTYSIVSQAYILAINEHGTPDNWGLKLYNQTSGKEEENILHYLRPYIKTIEYCGNLPNRCWKDTTTLNKSIFHHSTDKYYSKAILSDGTAVLTFVLDNTCRKSAGNINDICGDLRVDINGYKNPNILGIDVFGFHITKHKIVPSGTSIESNDFNSFETECIGPKANGRGCTAWVIYNGNMDYLHCPEKLGWDKASSCKK